MERDGSLKLQLKKRDIKFSWGTETSWRYRGHRQAPFDSGTGYGTPPPAGLPSPIGMHYFDGEQKEMLCWIRLAMK